MVAASPPSLGSNDVRMKRDHRLYLVAIVGGAAVWAFIAHASGRAEAWDSGVYFAVGIPAMCVISFVLALFQPERSWRWGVFPMVGQLVWLLLSEGSGTMLPLGVILFGVLSIPGIVAARIGASIATKRQRTGP